MTVFFFTVVNQVVNQMALILLEFSLDSLNVFSCDDRSSEKKRVALQIFRGVVYQVHTIKVVNISDIVDFLRITKITQRN